MNKLLWPLSAMLSVSSGISAKQETLPRADVSRLKEDVKVLTSTSKPRHYQNFMALKETTDYIKKIFRQHSEILKIQVFKVTSGESYENITASFGPRDAERFIIGAHYDVFGHYPGADDNASGVAALLELSRLLSSEKNLKHRIDLVAFALEEPPFFGGEDMGSAHYARLMHKQKVSVKMMIALDMIGYFSEKPDSQERPFPLQALYPSVGNFISLVGNVAQLKATRRVKELMLEGSPELKVEAVNAPTQIPGIDFSDHRNFWTHGYPGIMMTDTAFYRNPNYHSKNDTAETLDYETMAKVVQGLFFAAVNF